MRRFLPILALLLFAGAAHAQELTCPAGTIPLNPSGALTTTDLVTGQTRQHGCVDNNGFMWMQGEVLVEPGITAPALSASGQGRIYFDSGANKYKASENGGAYVNLVGGGGSGTVSSGTTGQLSKYTAATTVGNSTVADFGSTPTTHHLVACEVASTTCTLTDSGITDASPTGSGALVLATSPTLTTPALGTPSALVLTNATGLPAAQVPAVLLTSGTARTTANGAEIIVCTSTCTITPPATLTPGQQVCVQNDDNVSTVITLAASTNIQYEATARTSYGTANHTMTSGGAVKDQICIVAISTTKYNVFSPVGTWTNN